MDNEQEDEIHGGIGNNNVATRRGTTVLQQMFSSVPLSILQELEQQIHDMSPEKSAYTVRLKSILFNLKTNPSLLVKLQDGTISPAQLASMGPEEMASAHHADKRRKVCDFGYAMNTLSSEDLTIKVERKTGGTKMEWFGADVEDDVDLVMSSSAECVIHRYIYLWFSLMVVQFSFFCPIEFLV